MSGNYKKGPSKSPNPRPAGPCNPRCTDVRAEAQMLSDLRYGVAELVSVKVVGAFRQVEKTQGLRQGPGSCSGPAPWVQEAPWTGRLLTGMGGGDTQGLSCALPPHWALGAQGLSRSM